MAQAMPRPLPVFGPLRVLFGGHAAAWVAYAAALKGFWDFEILGLGIQPRVLGVESFTIFGEVQCSGD